MVRQLSIDQFENESRRVSMGTDSISKALPSPMFERNSNEPCVSKVSLLLLFLVRAWRAAHVYQHKQRVRRTHDLEKPRKPTNSPQLVLRELLHPRTWKPSEDRSFLLSAEQINQLCDTAESIFREEPSVLQLQGATFGFLSSAANSRAW